MGLGEEEEEAGRGGGREGGVERLVWTLHWWMTDSFLHQLGGGNGGSDWGKHPTTVRRVSAKKIKECRIFYSKLKFNPRNRSGVSQREISDPVAGRGNFHFFFLQTVDGRISNLQ